MMVKKNFSKWGVLILLCFLLTGCGGKLELSFEKTAENALEELKGIKSYRMTAEVTERGLKPYWIEIFSLPDQIVIREWDPVEKKTIQEDSKKNIIEYDRTTSEIKVSDGETEFTVQYPDLFRQHLFLLENMTALSTEDRHMEKEEDGDVVKMTGSMRNSKAFLLYKQIVLDIREKTLREVVYSVTNPFTSKTEEVLRVRILEIEKRS